MVSDTREMGTKGCWTNTPKQWFKIYGALFILVMADKDIPKSCDNIILMALGKRDLLP